MISDPDYNHATGRALLAPITSRFRGWPFEVVLPSISSIAGVVLVDQIRVMNWRARHAKIDGAVSGAVLEEVIAKLSALIGRN